MGVFCRMKGHGNTNLKFADHNIMRWVVVFVLLRWRSGKGPAFTHWKDYRVGNWRMLGEKIKLNIPLIIQHSPHTVSGQRSERCAFLVDKLHRQRLRLCGLNFLILAVHSVLFTPAICSKCSPMPSPFQERFQDMLFGG